MARSQSLRGLAAAIHPLRRRKGAAQHCQRAEPGGHRTAAGLGVERLDDQRQWPPRFGHPAERALCRPHRLEQGPDGEGPGQWSARLPPECRERMAECRSAGSGPGRPRTVGQGAGTQGRSLDRACARQTGAALFVFWAVALRLMRIRTGALRGRQIGPHANPLLGCDRERYLSGPEDVLSRRGRARGACGPARRDARTGGHGRICPHLSPGAAAPRRRCDSPSRHDRASDRREGEDHPAAPWTC